MSLTPGMRIGPYEIVSALGAGGMGEVYRARDTRLDRTVAIKILPSADPELRARFKAEAKAIAALQHPHICTLHDVGQQDGTDYLILEYLEGNTLADRLKRGPLPLDDVLKIAIEIAGALDKAHRAGIVHRDLKPANVMLTTSGAKLLDFGLTKLRPQIAAVGGFTTVVAQSTPPLTAAGSILGTLQYMAPEQLEGWDADARTDIFALGVVIYEMATGRRAFEGNSHASLIGAILKDDPPPMRTLQPLTPPMFERVVRKCLAKDAEDRWQSARDVATELQSIDTEQPQPATAAALLNRRTRRERWAWAAAAALASMLALLITSLIRPLPLPDPVRFSVPLPVDFERTDIAWGSPPAISADGRQIAYVGRRPDGTTQIYIRKFDQFEGSPVRGTEEGLEPFFSPNGQWLGFFSGGKLKKVPIGGGSPITLCDGYPRGATWGADDTIIFTSDYNGGLSRVSAGGGTPEAVTTLDPNARERSHRWPHFLPDAKAFLFTVGAIDFNEAQIVVRRLDTGSQHVVVQAGTSPQYAAGHVVFARGGSLLAVPFDIRRLEATGPPVPVTENVAMARRTGTSHFAISPSGSLIYIPGAMGASNNTLVWVDRDGRASPLAALQRGFSEVRISPDGKRIALVIGTLGEGSDVWIYEVTRGALTRFTVGLGSTGAPIWSPDGKQLIYQSTRRKGGELFRKAVDGSGAEEPLLAAGSSGHSRSPGSWSPDGKWLLFAEEGAGIFVLPTDAPGMPKPFAVAFKEDQPQFSPDGRWIAYRSPESGRSEVYVRPFPGPGGKWQVSTDGGSAPIWNRNGRELFYRNGDRVMAATVSLGETFAAGSPKELFRGAYDASAESSYDIAPDGQHFLMIRREQSSTPAQLNVVIDWSTEFRRVTSAR